MFPYDYNSNQTSILQTKYLTVTVNRTFGDGWDFTFPGGPNFTIVPNSSFSFVATIDPLTGLVSFSGECVNIPGFTKQENPFPYAQDGQQPVDDAVLQAFLGSANGGGLLASCNTYVDINTSTQQQQRYMYKNADGSDRAICYIQNVVLSNPYTLTAAQAQAESLLDAVSLVNPTRVYNVQLQTGTLRQEARNLGYYRDAIAPGAVARAQALWVVLNYAVDGGANNYVPMYPNAAVGVPVVIASQNGNGNVVGAPGWDVPKQYPGCIIDVGNQDLDGRPPDLVHCINGGCLDPSYSGSIGSMGTTASQNGGVEYSSPLPNNWTNVYSCKSAWKTPDGFFWQGQAQVDYDNALLRAGPGIEALGGVGEGEYIFDLSDTSPGGFSYWLWARDDPDFVWPPTV
jgi:hypothetical protein